jgi:hypothetical protein
LADLQTAACIAALEGLRHPESKSAAGKTEVPMVEILRYRESDAL